MSDPDIKTYSRGGRLAFTAGIMQGHVGETWTLSFWIRLAEGSVEGHDVIVYHYQNSGRSIAVGNMSIHPTSEWQLVQATGKVVDLAPRDGSTYDGTSGFYRYNGVAYSYGELWFYDRTASQRYEVYGVICAPADSGSGGVRP